MMGWRHSVLAFAATTALARAEDQLEVAKPKTPSLTDYCVLKPLSPASCAYGVNYAIAAECHAGYEAVSVACSISNLSPDLIINATDGARGVCDWFIGRPPDPQWTADATVLCRRRRSRGH